MEKSLYTRDLDVIKNLNFDPTGNGHDSFILDEPLLHEFLPEHLIHLLDVEHEGTIHRR